MSAEISASRQVAHVACTDDALTVDLADGRRISVPLAWFPRLLHATQAQRKHWQLAGAGTCIHWPDLDEDLSVEGLLRGAHAPQPLTHARTNTPRGL